MIAPAKVVAWAGIAATGVILAAIAQIPKPDSFWFQTWAGWATLGGLVVTASAVLALAKKVLGPTTGQQLRRGLEEPDTRRVLRDIWGEITKDDEIRRDSVKATLRRDVDAALRRIEVIEEGVMQMSKTVTELSAMASTLSRIEHHIETFGRTMDERGRQVDRIEGRLEEWDGLERRRRRST